MGDRGRRKRREKRQRPLLWIVFGGLGCLVGGLMLLTAPAHYAARRAYDAAPPCEGAVHEGCVRTVPAVVEGTDVRRRKADTYYVWLRVDDRDGVTQVDLPVPDVVFPALTPGREVYVRVWDGEVTGIDVPGAGSAETEDSPRMRAVELPLAGYVIMVIGAFAVWYGLALRRGTALPTLAPGPFGAAGRVLTALMLGSFAGFLLVVALDVYSPWAWLPAMALMSFGGWLLLHTKGRHGARR